MNLCCSCCSRKLLGNLVERVVVGGDGGGGWEMSTNTGRLASYAETVVLGGCGAPEKAVGPKITDETRARNLSYRYG